jgi:hypothetical protein
VFGDLLWENVVLPILWLWNDIKDFSLMKWKSKSLAASVCKLSWSAVVYLCGKITKCCQTRHPQISEDKLLLNVSWDVKTHIRGKGKFGKSPPNFELCNK